MILVRKGTSNIEVAQVVDDNSVAPGSTVASNCLAVAIIDAGSNHLVGGSNRTRCNTNVGRQDIKSVDYYQPDFAYSSKD